MEILQVIDPSPAVSKIVETGIIGALLIIVVAVLIYVVYKADKERTRRDERETDTYNKHSEIVQKNIQTLQVVSEKFSDSLDRNTQVLNEIKGMIRN